jgi:FtsH-binding integral membrane protein
MYQDFNEQAGITKVGGFNAYVSKVYGWMFLGLIITAMAAFFAIPMAQTILNPVSFIILAVIEIGLVIYLSARIDKLSVSKAITLFLVYSAINGLTLSGIFFAYQRATIVQAFGVATLAFGIMSLYGYFTKTDLTRIGNILLMGLIGFIIISIFNAIWPMQGLSLILSYVGLIIFLGLVAYDTQKIKAIYGMSIQDTEMQNKGAIISALALYLDFINIFLFLLRIFGSNDD